LRELVRDHEKKENEDYEDVSDEDDLCALSGDDEPEEQ
jgi:hypothetical protein